MADAKGHVGTTLLGNGAAITSAPDAGAQPKRTLGVVSLAFVAFVAVCGGPFGIESAVGAAGPFPTVVGVILLALIWSMPQSIMTAELSSIFRRNGGYVSWVMSGLGPFWGWVNAYNSIISNLFDLPIYPVLFAAYFRTIGDWEENSAIDWVVKGVVLGLVVLLNIMGMEIVALSSMTFTLVLLLPFVVEPFMVTHDPSLWLKVNPVINWPVFIASLLWSMQGWDSLGCIAGEVHDGGKTYPKGVALAIGMAVVNYVVPVLTAVSIDPDTEDWDEGDFARIGGMVKSWLGVWIGVSAAMSALGEFNAVMSTSSRALQAMGSYAMIPTAIAKNWDRTATPVPAILIQAGICAVLMSFGFEELVVIDTLFNNVSLLLEMAAFLRLKYTHAHIERPYSVPYGLPGAWIITVPKVGIILTSFALLDVNWQLWVGLGGNVLFVLTAFVWVWWMPKDDMERRILARGPEAEPQPEDAEEGLGAEDEAVGVEEVVWSWLQNLWYARVRTESETGPADTENSKEGDSEHSSSPSSGTEEEEEEETGMETGASVLRMPKRSDASDWIDSIPSPTVVQGEPDDRPKQSRRKKKKLYGTNV